MRTTGLSISIAGNTTMIAVKSQHIMLVFQTQAEAMVIVYLMYGWSGDSRSLGQC